MSTTTAKWETSTTAPEIAARLRSARRVVCLTHSKPDGDAAGSTLALARTLTKLGVEAPIWYVGPAPRWLDELAGGAKVHIGKPGVPLTPTATGQPEPDSVAVMDTGSWSQLAEVAPWLKGLHDRTVVMDHHLHGDGDVAPRKLIDSKCASTTQVITPVCCELLGCRPEELPTPIAEAIYLGLATDTQWFKLSNVSAPVLTLGAALLTAGVNHTKLYETIEQRDAASRWRLLGRALSSLELHDNGRAALMRISLRDFEECGADRNDTSGFADMVLHIATVRVAIVVSESDVKPGDPPITKVSARSKPGPDAMDVNALTMKLGGGGHARAAGAKLVGVSAEEARQRILALLT